MCDELANDAFRYGGLSKPGHAVYMFLLQRGDEGATVSEIAEAKGRNSNCVRVRLKEMQDVGMSRKQGKVWYGIADVDLKRAAQKLGTAGKGDRENERHRGERQWYRAWKTK